MGRRSLTGGVRVKGDDRIEFTFVCKGQRYRPTLPRIPSEANSRRARQQLAEIKRRIKQGTFVFGDEFPDFRYTDELPNTPESSSGDPRDAAKQERIATRCLTRLSDTARCGSPIKIWPSRYGLLNVGGLSEDSQSNLASRTRRSRVQERGLFHNTPAEGSCIVNSVHRIPLSICRHTPAEILEPLASMWLHVSANRSWRECVC
jgi:hypothetical protein